MLPQPPPHASELRHPSELNQPDERGDTARRPPQPDQHGHLGRPVHESGTGGGELEQRPHRVVAERRSGPALAEEREPHVVLEQHPRKDQRDDDQQQARPAADGDTDPDQDGGQAHSEDGHRPQRGPHGRLPLVLGCRGVASDQRIGTHPA